MMARMWSTKRSGRFIDLDKMKGEGDEAPAFEQGLTGDKLGAGDLVIIPNQFVDELVMEAQWILLSFMIFS
jgi:hypothetical protein